MKLPTACDVVIVGAGAAGLAAARELNRREVSAVVLEARDRIGGRVYTVRDEHTTTPIELGAEFVHGSAPIIRGLAHDAGIRLYDIAGERWRSEGKRLVHFRDFWDRLDRVMRLLDEEIEPDRSFAEFLAERPGGRRLGKERSLASQWVRGFHAADPADASERAIASGGSPGEDQEERTQARIVDGYSSLMNFLARDVPDIRLGAVVDHVEWQKEHVVVSGSDANGAFDVSAHAAIITCPLGVLKDLAFDPPLPKKHRNALDQIAMGHVVRASLVFDEPFWTTKNVGDEQTLRCLTFLHSGDGSMPVCWTSYPVEVPIVTAWFGFPEAIELAGQSDDDIESQTVGAVARLFHTSRKSLEKRVRACHTHNWTRDPFARGAYSYTRVGGIDAAKQLSRPIDGTLFLAGEAFDSEGRNGTVEGAIASAQRAARRIHGFDGNAGARVRRQSRGGSRK